MEIKNQDYFIELGNDLNRPYDHYIKYWERNHPGYKFLFSRSNNLTNESSKENRYYEIDDKTVLILIIRFMNSKMNAIKDYIEVIIDRSKLDSVKQFIWTFQKFKIIKKNTLVILTLNYDKESKKLSKTILSKFITKSKNDDEQNYVVKYRNKNLLDLRESNLMKIPFNSNSKVDSQNINLDIVKDKQIDFSNRYIFTSLDDIPENWKYLNSSMLEKNENYYDEISENVVGVIISFIFKENGEKIFYTTFIDREFYDTLVKSKDSFNFGLKHDKNRPDYMVYVDIRVNGERHRLNRFILNETDPNKVVDHINRDTLDNRRVNLRSITVRENNRNLSVRKNTPNGILGVHFDKRKNRWESVRSIKIGVSETGLKRLRSRSVLSSTFEDAVLNRRKLELLSDEDFLSEYLTPDLFRKYDDEGWFDNLYVQNY